MKDTDKFTFTEEGFNEFVNALTEYPEDERSTKALTAVSFFLS